MKVVILWFHEFKKSGLCFINENGNRIKYWFQKNENNEFHIKELDNNLLKFLEEHRILYCKNLLIPFFHGEKSIKNNTNEFRKNIGNYDDEDIKTNIKYTIKKEDFINYAISLI